MGVKQAALLAAYCCQPHLLESLAGC